MWWPSYVIFAGTLSLLALLRKDYLRANALMLILLGLMAVQLAKAALSTEAVWIADAMIWIVASVAIQRHSAGKLTLIAVLLLTAGLCIPVGRFLGEAYASGSFALFMSDIFGVSALLFLGGPVIGSAIRDFWRGVGRLVGGGGTGGLGAGVHSKGMDE